MDNKAYKKWIAPLLTAITFFVLNAWVKDLFHGDSLKSIFAIFSDCFFVSGVIVSGAGLLGWIGTFGQFDILSYGSRQFFGHFIHSLSEDLPNTFYEYRKQKDEKGRSWSKPTLWTGLIFLGLSVLSLVVYFIL